MSDHGLLAAIALVVWLPVTAVVFSMLPPARALVIAIFGGVLFLPELAHIKIPWMPPLTKNVLPYLYALLVCAVRWPGKLLSPRLGSWFHLTILVLVGAGVATALTNQDTLRYGSWIRNVIPGLTIKDGLAASVSSMFSIGPPMVLGAVFFREREHLRILLRGLVVFGLIYSLLMLVEVRLSPQLHRWVYGYAAHTDFTQVLRWGGYRPMVFMAHGLAVGLFALMTTMAATTMRRAGLSINGWPTGGIALYLLVILILCKSTAAIAYGMVLLPVILYAKPRTQVRIAMIMGVIVFIYPILRSADLFPIDRVLSLAGQISMDRHDSLLFRFENEEMLLKKARERLWFGWGTYGRNSIYDPEMGKEIAIADGQWIIVLGIQGAVGFFGSFFLLLYPVFYSFLRLRRITERKDQLLVAGLTLMVAVTALDLLPNGLFSTYPYFLSGALFGLVRRATRGQKWPATDDAPPRQDWVVPGAWR